MKRSLSKGVFETSARRISIIAGHPLTFFFAVLSVFVWALSGPYFHFSETWQLVINTGTTIVTFLLIFLLQCSQNRDTQAIQVKLDEIIRSIETARNDIIDCEELPASDLTEIQKEMVALREAKEETGNTPVKGSRVPAASPR